MALHRKRKSISANVLPGRKVPEAARVEVRTVATSENDYALPEIKNSRNP